MTVEDLWEKERKRRDRIAAIQTFGCLTAVLAALVALPLLFGLGVEASFDHDVARVESLRTDAAEVSADVGEDVIGQVTQWNQTIASNKFVNSIPVIGFFISDRWEGVEPIEVPR